MSLLCTASPGYRISSLLPKFQVMVLPGSSIKKANPLVRGDQQLLAIRAEVYAVVGALDYTLVSGGLLGPGTI